jgi:hypothetical protein
VVEREDLIGLPQQLSVLYGAAPGPPAKPVQMGALGTILALEPMRLALTGFVDLTDDLMVLTASYPDETNPSLAPMIGNTRGVLLAPFLLSTDRLKPSAVAVGDFTGDGKLDVVAIVGTGRAFVLQGSGGGQLSKLADYAPPGLVYGPCILAATGKIAGLPVDQVVAIDGVVSRTCVQASAGVGPALRPPKILIVTPVMDGPPTSDLLEVPGDYRDPQQMALVDLDGAGGPELVVQYAGGPKGIVVYANVSGHLQIDASARPVANLTGTPIAFVAMQVVGDLTLELVVLTDRGVFVARRGADGGYTADATAVIPVGPSDADRLKRGLLAGGDLDGDGLADLVLSQEQQAYIWHGVSMHAVNAEDAK